MPVAGPSQIQIDLTPWVRAPQSGIGRTARWSFEHVRNELTKYSLPLGAVSRSRRIPGSHLKEIRMLGMVERGLGRSRTLHHSFEHRLPPLKRCTKLLSIHDLWTLREGNPYQSRKFQLAQAPILKKAIDRADWITTPLPSVLSELHDRFPETRHRSSQIPWASTLSPQLKPAAISGLDPQRPFLLTVAVIENRKNLIQVARALEHTHHLDWLVLGKIGFGGETILSEIRELVPSLQHRADVSEAQLAWAYQNAAALVLPSLEEGFGLPVLEAAQFGTPLILSRIPAFTDLCAVHREDSAIFYDSLQGLQEILHHLDDAPGSFGLPDSRRLVPHYSWKKTASSFVNLYRQLGFIPSSLA
jgi:glycosyltransferase involved in cell wall biosynthesis